MSDRKLVLYAVPDPQKEFLEMAEKDGLEVRVATTFEEVHHLLSTQKFDAVIIAPELPYASQTRAAEH
jgi:DNA-binding response OmpR family regulator